MKYMEKLGLRDFSGISLPDESLNLAFSLPYPIFYNDGKINAKKKTYFDQLNKINWLINALQSHFGEMMWNNQLLLPEKLYTPI